MVPTINYYSLQHSVSNINGTFTLMYLIDIHIIPYYIIYNKPIILYKIRKYCRTHGFRVEAAAFKNLKPDRKTIRTRRKVY